MTQFRTRDASGPRDPGAVLQVGLLGPLTLRRGGSRVELTGPKRRALLILLALHAGTLVGRERIVEALWPDRRSGREESTLRVHVSHLRDVVEPLRDGDPSVLLTHEGAYVLPEDRIALDIDAFERLAQEGRARLGDDPQEALSLLNDALGLWRGRPLQDVEYEEFAQDEIRRLEAARADVMEDRAEALIRVGEDVLAIGDLEAQVRALPMRERPVRLLMEALYRTGRQAEALRVARGHVRQLARQGLEPSPLLSGLEDRILRHDPALLPEGAVSVAEIGPGRSVRGYELREVAGAGTMGVVYRAFQPAVGREVAVKVVHTSLAETPEFVRRFAEEARVVASLEHPHIVPLHDFWRDPVGAFLVMRWMDGGSLADRIGSAWDDVALGRVFGQLAEALAYAHSAGVVHRDIRPANVLFDAAGNGYLCDFGLAVPGVDMGSSGRTLRSAVLPYAPPESGDGAVPTVAADVFALGVLLAEAAGAGPFPEASTRLEAGVLEVVRVATAPDPADRYPDMLAFRAALSDAIGPAVVPAPRQVRRNPYKGLAAFEEGDRADFYGRDDLVETLIDMVDRNGLVAIIGASGSGKSSLVKAGLIPELRDGAVRGSDEWAIVSMVPGTDPFDEFHLALREAAVGRAADVHGQSTREVRAGFDAALDGPNSRALLVVDQFEELFSTEIDERSRERFLDDLAELAADPAHRIRVTLTLRADFADRPLAHPRFGDLVSRASVLVGPMQPDQVDDVIRRPAARVGVQVEPGLVAEILRDVSSAPAYLPLLQYVLSELFERRIEDRLTVQAYRSLGGLTGVLERRAEATFEALETGAQRAARQLFLRMVHLGEQGEETRRRLPLTELRGLGGGAEVDGALEAFTTARLLTYDRDPVTRTPTVEVAHEMVIRRWTRYRVWIDEARADLLAHRRLVAAAATWVSAGEDPTYLLTGGPLVSATDVASSGRIGLNEEEARFLAESRTADERSRRQEEERSRHELALQSRASRRLRIVFATAAMALVVAVFAGFAWTERQRANDLAATQERQSLARELAAAATTSLSSADHDLALLLAIAAADETLAADGEILPEAVDALHLAVTNPRPAVIVEGGHAPLGGRVIDYSGDGSTLVMLAEGGGAMVLATTDGAELGRIPPVEEASARGVDFHPDGEQVLTVHPDAVRVWNWRSGELRWIVEAEFGVSTAGLSQDGTQVAVADEAGVIQVLDTESGDLTVEIDTGADRISSVDFDSHGQRLLSSVALPRPSGQGVNWTIQVWDLATASETSRVREGVFIGEILQATWSPATWDLRGRHAIAVTSLAGEVYVIDARTGGVVANMGNAATISRSIAFDATNLVLVTSGSDGYGRLYSPWLGGEPAFVLPNGGLPVRDAALNPAVLEIATVGVDGSLRIWRDFLGSELPERVSGFIAPHVTASASGDRWVSTGYRTGLGLAPDLVTVAEVFDTATGEQLLRRPTLEPSFSHGSAISPDGSLVAFVGPAGNVEVVDVDTGASVVVPDSYPWSASFAFSPDGRLLAGGGLVLGPEPTTVAIWETATGDLHRVLTGHGEPLPLIDDYFFGVGMAVAFSPDGRQLASAAFDGTARLWDLESGEHRIVHQRSEFEAVSVAFSPDGSNLAVSDGAGTVLLFDPVTGESRDLESVSGRTHLAFSPDGRVLAGAGPDPEAPMWDVESGRIVRRFHGAVYPARSVAFLDGGRELLVSSGESVQRRYLLDPLDLLELARDEVERELTEDECQRYLRRSCEG